MISCPNTRWSSRGPGVRGRRTKSRRWSTGCGPVPLRPVWRVATGPLADAVRPDRAYRPGDQLVAAAAANDVAAAVRRIVDAAVAGLPSERRRAVLTYRLGLGDASPQTLQAIGERLDISRERVRQIQDKALSGLRRSPSGAPSRRLLSDLCAEAAAAGASRTHTLLTLSRLGMPGADPRVAVAVLAILTARTAPTHCS